MYIEDNRTLTALVQGKDQVANRVTACYGWHIVPTRPGKQLPVLEQRGHGRHLLILEEATMDSAISCSIAFLLLCIVFAATGLA